MTRPLGPKLLSTFAAIVLGLSACGGDDSVGGSDENSSKQSSSAPAGDDPQTPSEAPTADPADEAIADAALLTLQDFPPGWEAAPASEEDDRESKEEFAACVGVDYDQLYDETNAEAESPDFTSENDEEVSVKVTVESDEEAMAEAFQIVTGPEYPDCVVQGITKAVENSSEDSGEEVEVGEITVNEMSIGSFGDETLAFRATIPLEAQGISIDAVGEFVYVRVGRALAFLTSFGLPTVLPTEEFAGYIEKAVQRLQDALAKSE